MSRRRDNSGEEERMEAEVAVENGTDLPERWSARRKSELVLRLLKGEDIGSVSRETQVRAGSECHAPSDAAMQEIDSRQRSTDSRAR